MEAAMLEAQERWRVITLDTVQCSDPKIAAVGREGAMAHAEVVALAHESDDPTAAFGLIASILTHNWIGAGVGLFHESAKEDSKKNHIRSVVQRRRAVNDMLPELAKTVAGPAVEKDPLGIDYDENWFQSNTPDRLKLTNNSGSAMTRCTLQVDIRGIDGVWVRNVHFVPAWPAGRELFTDYYSPSDIDAAAGFTNSVTQVQEVVVSVWCDEMAHEGQRLQYAGAPRDEDMLRALNQKLDVKVDYVHKPFTEQGPSLGISFSGIANLPACRITLVCNGGEEHNFEFARAASKDGERVSYPTRGALRDCPKSVEVILRLDTMGADWKKTVEIASRR
jgi:hypothetical protein